MFATKNCFKYIREKNKNKDIQTAVKNKYEKGD
jgi:hypothetical protein